MADAIINDVEAESYNACFMAPLGLCVEEAIYTGVVDLPPIAGGYTLTYQRCCRNFSIVNVPTGTDVGITLTTEIPGPELATLNANPEFATHPPLVVCLNAPFVFNHSASDTDGDQLVYEFCAPLNTNVNGCPDSATILLNDVVVVHPNPIAGFEILGSSNDFIESYIEVTSVATGAVASNYFK